MPACRPAGPPALHLRPRQFRPDLGHQPRVLLQAQDEVHPVRLAPGHQRIPGKPAVGAHHDVCPRPALPNVPDDARHLLDGARRSTPIRRPQARRQQMAPAKNVERQVAVAVVIAVEEAPLLRPVHRIIGGIEIEDDLLRRSLVRLQEQVDQQALDGHRIMADLVIAARFQLAQLQSIERRFAGQRCTVLTPRRKLARQHRHHWIVAKLIVVVEILIAERNPKHPLAHQRRNLMLDQIRTPCVIKAGGKPIRQLHRVVGRAQQQRAGVRRDRPAVKAGDNLTPFNGCKSKQICATLCRHRGAPRITRKSLRHNNFR